MRRRNFIATTAAAPALAAAPAQRAKALANNYVTVYESPDPATVYAMSPGIASAERPAHRDHGS